MHQSGTTAVLNHQTIPVTQFAVFTQEGAMLIQYKGAPKV